MHRVSVNLIVVLSVLVCLIYRAHPAYAQQDTGSITGTVFDSSQAVVPGAAVTVKNTGTGMTRRVTTGERGTFVITPLQIGSYELTVEASGFQSEVRRNLELQIQQKLDVQVVLQVGAATQKVVVDATGPALQTEDSSLGQVVGTRDITNLPLNGRNVYQLVTLTPGVVAQPNGMPAISGQTAQNQSYVMDGVDNNNYQGNMSSGGAYTLSPSPDAVQEFKVQTNNYSAEFGQSAGGVVNVTTKDGTNQLHGVIYEYVRNAALDTNNYFALTKPPFQQNQFGATLGGPIVIPKIYDGHNKLFFFADYEGFLSDTGTTQSTTMPSSAWRTGDLSNYLTGNTYIDSCTGAIYDTGQLFDPNSSHTTTCLSGATATVRNPISYNGRANVINPAQISSAALNVIGLLPQTNSGSQFIWSPVNTFNYQRGDIKISNQWGQHDRIFGRYGITNSPPTGVPAYSGLGSPGTFTISRQQGVAVGDSHIFSANVVNELRYTWSQNNTNANLIATSLNASTLGLGGIPYQSGLLGGLPTLQFSDFGGNTYGNSSWSPSIYDATDNQISDVLSMTRGAHSFKIGGAFNHYGWDQYQSPDPMGYYDFTGAPTSSTTVPQGTQGEAVNGSGFAQFMYGLSDYNALSTGIKADNLRTTGAVFIQDDWKVNPRLVLNLGLRWEFGTGMSEAQNRVSGIDLNTGAFEIPKSRENKPPSLPAGVPVEYVDSNTLMSVAQKNFGPRVGFSYQINSKTVIRSGFGIFFANPFVAGTIGYPLNPPFGITVFNHNIINIAAGFPSTFLSNFDPTVLQLYLIPVKPKYPTTNNWNLAFQRDLPGNTNLQIAYAGSASAHVNAGFDINQPYPTADASIPITSRRPYPALGIMALIGTEANANYNSLQTTFQKRYSNGLTFLLSYTWSHSLDDAPSSTTLGTGNTAGDTYDFYRDPRNTSLDYGNSFFDIRDRFVFSSLYELPVGRGRLVGGHLPGALNQIIGGWQVGSILQYQTGFHFSAVTFNDPSNSDIYSYAGAAYPNVIGKIDDYSNCPNGHKSIDCWLNPQAFGPSNPGEFGNEGRNILVGPGDFNLDFSTLKSFPIRDRARIVFRGEFFNLINHPNFSLPSNVVESSTFGQITSTIGNPREIQFALRLEY